MPTPPDPGQPQPGPDLEPIRVLRPRRFDALAELMREIRPDPVTYEPLGTAPRPPSAPRRTAHPAEADTDELPPVPAARPPRTPAPGVPAWDSASGPGPRRAAVAVAVAAAALLGFTGALLLPGRQQAAATARPSPPATTAVPATPATPIAAPATPAPSAPDAPSAPIAPADAADPDGPGTLRQGNTGPEVTELQQRLLRIPDVYRDGSADGTYDATLTEAVARFQLWYGISGDETGVYGDDTRRALESRTGLGDDS
ncbi:peptidoglycan-binding protein [Streptomyces actinomycinicus]|uniref:Peptidoglycan-binding protein n=1 Tax=Streptomyces actinomycinicus TaxID=1695166 RepID=A0A937EL18_9ACTN|nr:peptidoglycan-binding domain-containing protein [Streptomyces actinomycinicus]MBL1084362.1 peptidoglycan-binding protein [Streptomyces actinomycinicus]